MADTAVVNGKAKKVGGKRKTMAEKMAEESSKVTGGQKKPYVYNKFTSYSFVLTTR